MGEAYIIDACRTPRGIGKQGRGALAHMVEAGRYGLARSTFADIYGIYAFSSQAIFVGANK